MRKQLFMKAMKETSSEQYERFIELYIQLYYEPIVEEYEEIKYFTKDFDKQMYNLVKNKQIQGVKIKE